MWAWPISKDMISPQLQIIFLWSFISVRIKFIKVQTRYHTLSNHQWSRGLGLERENILSPCYCHQISTMLCLLLRQTMDSSCEICSIDYFTSTREGHGAMFRVWRSADVAACRAVWNPAWCRIFREISCFSPLNLGALLKGPLGMRHFQCCQFWKFNLYEAI